MFLHRVILVVDDADPPCFSEFVVVEGRKTGQVWPNGGLTDPPVEPNKVRVVFLYDLDVSG